MKKLFSALLAGAMLLAMGLSLAACGSKATQAFYTLEAAYQNGLVEYADVLEIHKNYVLPEEQKLSLQEEEAIKQSFFENFDTVMQDKDVSGPVPDAEEEISVTYYHGKFNGYYVVTMAWYEDKTGLLRREYIGKSTFLFPLNEYIFVWTDPDRLFEQEERS